MMDYEKFIMEEFARRFPSSAAACGGRTLRMRAREFPHLHGPDEIESFLEAVERLKREGILRIFWTRRRKGESIDSIELIASDLVFEKLGLDPPDGIAKRAAITAQEVADLATERGDSAVAELFRYIASRLSPEDGAAGVDERFVRDMASICSCPMEKLNATALRALSVESFSDSKRLEAMLPSMKRLIDRAYRAGIKVPDLSWLERSYPETAIGGDVILCFDDGHSWDLGGMVVHLPRSTVARIVEIRPSAKGGSPHALSIENKESFYSLCNVRRSFSCLVYVGGHVNPAVAGLLSAIARSGFSISHAGDLDPDGLLIMEEVMRSSGIAVTPHRMDGTTFDEYSRFARPLTQSIVSRLRRLDSATLEIDGVSALVERIRETSSGIEQEIISY